MCFTARPRMGGRRAVGRRCRGGPRRDRPLMGSRPRPPHHGGAVTRLGSCADIGCRVSSVNKSMDSGCQSGFRINHRKSRSAILQRFCGIPLAEKRDVVVKKNMSHLVRSSGVRCADVVGASRGAVRVIGNLLVSGRALRARSAIVSGMSRWACRALHSFVCRDLVVSRWEYQSPPCLFKKMLVHP